MTTVFESVRRDLERHRRAGESWDYAWTQAVGTLTPPAPRGTAAYWEWRHEIDALMATEKRWRAAYRRKQPSRKDRALNMVSLPP